MNPTFGSKSASPSANVGRIMPLKTGPTTGGNVIVNGPTQLITGAVPLQQWIVTLLQPTTPNGSTPWASTFDGGVFPPVAPSVFTAPVFPVGSPMQVHLRWGAGGVMFETAFDYPAVGGVFGVTADAMNLDVTFRGALPTFAAASIPLVGAFMVPGQAADPAPLRWRELGAGGVGLVTIAPGSASFAVKPYARSVLLSSADIATRWRIDWVDSNGALLRTDRHNLSAVGDLAVAQVPASATVMTLWNDGAGASTWAIEWLIGLT